MPPQVIEGTWEEIKLREAELIGHYLRVTIRARTSTSRKSSRLEKNSTVSPNKTLNGFGAFKGKVGNSEEFARDKQLEIEREERRF